jgi:hypothetical protein
MVSDQHITHQTCFTVIDIQIQGIFQIVIDAFQKTQLVIEYVIKIKELEREIKQFHHVVWWSVVEKRKLLKTRKSRK